MSHFPSEVIALTDRDQAFLAGEFGKGGELAMRIVVHLAEVMGAESLLDIVGAHIDGCVFYGQAGLEFAERLRDQGARVAVPTTLNISSLDLLHPDLYRGDDETKRLAKRLMDAYVDMGGRPTWTCAPYQLPERPGFGDQIAWAESNAIVFANSVLGARTHRYGDFIDICAAVTGRAPAAGLHMTENRRGQMVFDLSTLPGGLLTEDVFFPVLGHLMGQRAGQRIPVLVGLDPGTTEDQLKALGAAAASSGAVALFHAVGVTPEAPDLEMALQGGEPLQRVAVTPDHVAAARDSLTTDEGGRLAAVCLGTPHLSAAGFEHLAGLLDGRRLADGVDGYVNTGRDLLAEISSTGWVEAVEASGVRIVTDTCTYVTPILGDIEGVVMTDSGKWAYYAPNNLGVEVVYGSTAECVESAVAGRIVRDRELWHGV